MDFPSDMATVLLVCLGALVLFATEALAADLVALLALVVLAVLGVAEPDVLLAGFANPAVITIGAMFVMSEALSRTGVVERFTEKLTAVSGSTPTTVLLVSLPLVTVLSAFVNNTPIIVMMIPVIFGLSAARGIAPSKLLMPLSFASMIGGACTLIGTSTNLVVSSLAVKAGMEPISMFEFSGLGAVLAVMGFLYLVFAGPRLLPARSSVTASSLQEPLHEYLTELMVPQGSTLVGRTVGQSRIVGAGVRVLQVIRDEEIHWPPLDGFALAAGDVLITKGRLNDLRDAKRLGDVTLTPELGDADVRIGAAKQKLVELVVTPGSRFVGATIREIGFRRHFNVSVLALQRSGRHHLRGSIVDRRIRVGDVLLVQAKAEELDELRQEEGLLVLERPAEQVVARERAPLALAALGGFIACASLTDLPVSGCALAAALFLVLSGCLTPRQAYRSLDLRTLVLIAAMIGVGLTAQSTGAMDWIAKHVLDVARPFGPYGVLGAIYVITVLLTSIISNAAAAVLMVPLAIAAATDLSVNVRPFVVAVAFAASAAFATPVGYQTNTIVYAPGGYRFTDFVRLGLPLNIGMCIVTTLLIPYFWPF